jgi:hypothetical protein
MEKISKFKNCQRIDTKAIFGGAATCYTHVIDVGATQNSCGSDDQHYMIDDGGGATKTR